MGAQEWIALGALIVAIFGSSIGIVVKLSDNKNQILDRIAANKEDLDNELLAIRMAQFEEYKILRKEMNDISALTYREFGESLRAIREKINVVELWIRDELSKTRHTLIGGMDQRHEILRERLDEIDGRVRLLEIRMGPSALLQHSP